jgi:hypothetical protein
MKMRLIAHQIVVWQVWIFSQYSMKLMTRLQLYFFVLITEACTICSPYWLNIQVTMQDAPALLSDMPNA